VPDEHPLATRLRTVLQRQSAGPNRTSRRRRGLVPPAELAGPVEQQLAVLTGLIRAWAVQVETATEVTRPIRAA
jgi:hypothetical protein